MEGGAQQEAPKSFRKKPIWAPASSVMSYPALRSSFLRALKPKTGRDLPASEKKVTCSLNAIRFCSASAISRVGFPASSDSEIS